MTPACRPTRAFLLTADEGLRRVLTGLPPEAGLEWTVFARGRTAVETLFNEPPDLLVVDADLPDLPGTQVAALVKSENVYRQLPVVLVATSAVLAGLDLGRVDIDDFLLAPVEPVAAAARLALTLARASRSLDANPLTRLPGNTSIIQRLQSLIDGRRDFALAYLDLDHFKSFNDAYGFSRGDEVLMMTARIMVNTVRSLFIDRGVGGEGPVSFAGHIGGDDFVFIVPPELAETACTRFIESFDRIVPSFYDPEDAAAGRLRSVDRQGVPREFPLMAVSIAVVFNRDGSLTHFGEASAIAMALKKKAKENPRSCYVLDRRQPGAAQP